MIPLIFLGIGLFCLSAGVIVGLYWTWSPGWSKKRPATKSGISRL